MLLVDARPSLMQFQLTADRGVVGKVPDNEYCSRHSAAPAIDTTLKLATAAEEQNSMRHNPFTNLGMWALMATFQIRAGPFWAKGASTGGAANDACGSELRATFFRRRHPNREGRRLPKIRRRRAMGRRVDESKPSETLDGRNRSRLSCRIHRLGDTG